MENLIEELKRQGHEILAYDIDNKRFDEILGTLAGDDTVMMVLAEGVGPETVYGLLAQALPGVDWK